MLLFTRYNIACVAGWGLSLLRCALQLIALWYLVVVHCGGAICGFCCFVVWLIWWFVVSFTRLLSGCVFALLF